MFKSQQEKASSISGCPEDYHREGREENGGRHIWDAIFRLLDSRKTLESWKETRSMKGND